MYQKEGIQDILIGVIVSLCLLAVGGIFSLLIFLPHQESSVSAIPLLTAVATLLSSVFTGGLLYFAYRATKEWHIRLKDQARYDITKLISERHLGIAIHLKQNLNKARSEISEKDWSNQGALILEQSDRNLIRDINNEFQRAMHSKLECTALMRASAIESSFIEGALDFQSYHDALTHVIEAFEAINSNGIYMVTADNREKLVDSINNFEVATIKFISSFSAR